MKKLPDGFAGQQSCILPEARRKYCATHALCRKLYITDIGFYPHAGLHNRERPAGCAQYILIYCIAGEGWYRLNGKTYAVKANQYFILPRKEGHEYGAADKTPWSIYWVHFTGEQADHLSRFLMPRKYAGPQTIAPSPMRQMLFEDILHHLEFMNNTESIIYANCNLYSFLSSFKQVPLKAADQISNPIQSVIALMKNNLEKNLTLKDFAAYVNLSASHLSALFREKTKYSPVSLFTSLKIQKASQLLQESDYNIKTIALQLGYDDQYHFSRVFKKVMGVSPRTFKQTGK
ncbi:helix-turn-helix domain-containing protein [Chitinophaga rhizophila]|uniref:Helix-turn-helix domain-containing protein n=1 Tax=Chitinophaga rhizophila TaxID=2866212 RepID=A0ABS7GK80_9BACT|nr:helix-turn-helix domain-containing protein [Chitinophaga rhizophila]MBW8687062.1 helix-turn-helix domain-containing protein [Chitinophaga rhizophila]